MAERGRVNPELVAEARAYYEKHILGYASDAAFHANTLLVALAEAERREERLRQMLKHATDDLEACNKAHSQSLGSLKAEANITHYRALLAVPHEAEPTEERSAN